MVPSEIIKSFAHDAVERIKELTDIPEDVFNNWEMLERVIEINMLRALADCNIQSNR